MPADLWSRFYCGVSHFAGRAQPGARIQITIVDLDGLFEVSRLDLVAERRANLREPGSRPGGVFTPTHVAYRHSLDAAREVGEAWARGDYSAPERL